MKVYKSKWNNRLPKGTGRRISIKEIAEKHDLTDVRIVDWKAWYISMLQYPSQVTIPKALFGKESGLGDFSFANLSKEDISEYRYAFRQIKKAKYPNGIDPYSK